MTSLLSTEPWLRDPDVVQIPWRTSCEATDGKATLCFAVFAHDGVCAPHPPIQRGIMMVEEAVKGAGHNV